MPALTDLPCPNCGRLNRPDARFCASCRSALTQPAGPTPGATGSSCPKCQAINPLGAKFCNACGSAMQPASSQPRSTTGALSLNTTLQHGRYVIEGLLGQGGMGAVYITHDTRLQAKRWAVKEMSTAGLTTTEDLRNGVEAFRREATMLATLSHRHLPKVVDNFEEDGREYLVMELVEGQTLASLLSKRNKPLPPDQVIAWGEQLCDVLGYLHSRKPPIIFRDLKPDNIMIDNDGVVKLIDFGIARHFTPGKKADTTAIGTTGYAPPEQYGKGQTDARSDIYALAATLHQLLTRRDPSQDPFNFPPARQLNPAVPQGLSAALQKALSTSPADRWPSTTDFRKALSAPAPASPQSGPTAVATPPAVQMRAAPPVTPSMSTPPPKPVSQTVQAAPAGRKRASFLAYLLIVGAFTVVSVVLRRANIFTLLQGLVGDETLSGLLYLTLLWTMPILAYLLTRWPLAAFLVYGIGEWLGTWGPITDFDYVPLQNTLITAAAIEAVFLLSGYRTRGSLVGVIAAVTGAAVSLGLTLVRYGSLPGASEIVMMVLAALVGGVLAALVATLLGRG